MPSISVLGPLPSVAPTPPNFHLCSSHYGEDLKFADCNDAGHLILHYALPLNLQVGGCIVAVERAGPEASPPLMIDRETVRGMIGWVISQCVTPTGLGGFVTGSFERMVNYITDPSTRLTEPPPPWGAFFTVTVAGKPNYKGTGPIEPGDYDPAVPEVVAGALRGVISGWRKGNPYARRYIKDAQILDSIAAEMDHKFHVDNWWEYPERIRTNQMAYECDANLGSPTAVDCGNLEYSSLLGAPSDPVSVGPGMDHFLSLGTCSAAITASVHLVLTWNQIKIALDALINRCVSNPLQPAKGGRAYYATPLSYGPSSRRMKRGTIDGLNALPPHANVTIFKQNESIRDAAQSEFETCTWRQILRGGAIATCH